MKNIQILDCTLRDGGRIINCDFNNRSIAEITDKLSASNIDIVEVGFLRGNDIVEYKGNSTFFTDVNQIKPFLNKQHDTIYTAFIDYGMYNFDLLDYCDGLSIDGIRVGFTKKNFDSNKDDIIRCLNIVKDRGYKLFVQGVNSLGYNDKELLQIIDFVNEVEPYSFGIVDTYGAMYIDDVRRFYQLVDHNLSEDICIDFHSHNNFQLSFSFAQEIITLSNSKRKIILDATLNGMGKGAGNLNTELIVDFLSRKMGYNYDFDLVLDIIDEYIYKIKLEHTWGYSIPSVMAGVYRSHPNNIIYLTEKFRLSTKDIKYIISMIDPELRQRYDYDNIDELYRVYNSNNVDDRKALDTIREMICDRSIVLVFPGVSINKFKKEILQYIEENNSFIISVNFDYEYVKSENKLVFFGSPKRYHKIIHDVNCENVVVVSNIKEYEDKHLVVNYESLIERNVNDFDNTGIMLFNLLFKIGAEKYAIAGLDGYKKGQLNYFSNNFEEERFNDAHIITNKSMRSVLKRISQRVDNKRDITFITPSEYSDIFI